MTTSSEAADVKMENEQAQQSLSPNLQVHISVVGDASAGIKPFIISVLTSAGVSEDNTSNEGASNKSQRIVKDISVTMGKPSVSGKKVQGRLEKKKKRIPLKKKSKEKMVRVVLTAEPEPKFDVLCARSDGIIFLFNVLEGDSLDNALKLKRQVSEKLANTTVGDVPLLFLVGNGSYDSFELTDTEMRHMEDFQKNLIEENGMKKYYEVCSKSAHNVTDAISDIIKIIIQNNENSGQCKSSCF